MAVKYILVDDFTGEEIVNQDTAPDPVFFEIYGKRYKLDLSEESIEVFKTALGKFWEKAVEDKPVKATPQTAPKSPEKPEEPKKNRFPQRTALSELNFTREQLFVIMEDLAKQGKIKTPAPGALSAGIGEAEAALIRQEIEVKKIARIENPEDVKATPGLTAAIKARAEQTKKMQAGRAAKKGEK